MGQNSESRFARNDDKAEMSMHLTMPNLRGILEVSGTEEIDLYSKKNHPNQIKDSMILDSIFDKYYRPSRNEKNSQLDPRNYISGM